MLQYYPLVTKFRNAHVELLTDVTDIINSSLIRHLLQLFICIPSAAKPKLDMG